MYHAACKVEFQPFNRSYSQLTFSIFYIKALLDVAADVSLQVQSQLSFYVRADVLDSGGQGASCSCLFQ